MELSEEEKVIMDLLKPVGQMPLGELKDKSSLSGKKWDKSTKNLAKLGIFEVSKTDDGLFALAK